MQSPSMPGLALDGLLMACMIERCLHVPCVAIYLAAMLQLTGVSTEIDLAVRCDPPQVSILRRPRTKLCWRSSRSQPMPMLPS